MMPFLTPAYLPPGPGFFVDVRQIIPPPIDLKSSGISIKGSRVSVDPFVITSNPVINFSVFKKRYDVLGRIKDRMNAVDITITGEVSDQTIDIEREY